MNIIIYVHDDIEQPKWSSLAADLTLSDVRLVREERINYTFLLFLGVLFEYTELHLSQLFFCAAMWPFRAVLGRSRESARSILAVTKFFSCL